MDLLHQATEHNDRTTGTAEVIESISNALKRLGLPLETAEYRAVEVSRDAKRLTELGIEDLLAEAGKQRDAEGLLFEVATVLAYSSVDLSWYCLHDLPRRLALPRSQQTTELPEAWNRRVVPCLLRNSVLSCLAFGESPAPGEILITNRDGSERSARVDSAHWQRRPLPGFKTGSLLTIDADRLPTGSPLATPHCLDLIFYSGLQHSLLTGQLRGALFRLVDLAYAYARNRQSGGKPIIRHQAVALRLAELTIHSEALGLLLSHDQAVFRTGVAGLGVLNRGRLDHISRESSRICRNAMQVAAGHGYVEGLLFKTLNEQCRSLLWALLMHACPESVVDNKLQAEEHTP